MPFVQTPGVAVYTGHGLNTVHVTVSSGASVAISANCYFGGQGKSLKEHFSETRKAHKAFQAGNHRQVHDFLSENLPSMK